MCTESRPRGARTSPLGVVLTFSSLSTRKKNLKSVRIALCGVGLRVAMLIHGANNLPLKQLLFFLSFYVAPLWIDDPAFLESSHSWTMPSIQARLFNIYVIQPFHFCLWIFPAYGFPCPTSWALTPFSQSAPKKKKNKKTFFLPCHENFPNELQ